MNCDIHTMLEYKSKKGNWKHLKTKLEFFSDRDYNVFAFLAGVRNYSAIEPIGFNTLIPEGVSKKTIKEFSKWGNNAHSEAWVNIDDLNKVNYDEIIEDRRCMINGNGGSTCEVGHGEKMSRKEYLGKYFFVELEAINKLKPNKEKRLIYWFDN